MPMAPTSLASTHGRRSGRAAASGRASGGDARLRGVWPRAGRRLDILGRVMMGRRRRRLSTRLPGFCSSLLRSLLRPRLLSPVVAGLCESGGGLILGMKGEKNSAGAPQRSVGASKDVRPIFARAKLPVLPSSSQGGPAISTTARWTTREMGPSIPWPGRIGFPRPYPSYAQGDGILRVLLVQRRCAGDTSPARRACMRGVGLEAMALPIPAWPSQAPPMGSRTGPPHLPCPSWELPLRSRTSHTRWACARPAPRVRGLRPHDPMSSCAAAVGISQRFNRLHSAALLFPFPRRPGGGLGGRTA